MSGKNHCLNPLELRKQLLIAESELNRTQLVQDFQGVADGVHALANQARILSFVVPAAASLVASLVSFRRKKNAPAAGKTSWLQTVLKGAELISAIWQAFRSQGRGRD